MKTNKTPNYKARQITYTVLGWTVFVLFTFGGFFGYEAVTNYSGLVDSFTNFVVVDESTMKLNGAISMVLIVAGLITLWALHRKNKDLLKGKTTLSLLIGSMFFYLMYCIVNVALFTMIGAFVGSAIQEAVFIPLSNKAKQNAEFQTEVRNEIVKEKSRVKVRQEMVVDNNYGEY